MNQLEQDIINSANVKLAGIAKGMLFSALGGATSGGIAGAGLGSLLGGTIGAVKNYRNSAGTFGNRLKAGLTGGLRGGAKGGLIGGGVGAGLGSSAALLSDELSSRGAVADVLGQIGRMRQRGDVDLMNLGNNSKRLASYLEGLNDNGDNYKRKHLLDSVFGGLTPDPGVPFSYLEGSDLDTLKRDALSKARELYYDFSPSQNFRRGGDIMYPLRLAPSEIRRAWRMTL